MFVEDEPDLYEILSVLFELWGHDIIAFQTGEEAVDWLTQVEQDGDTEDLPELALLDIRLPGEIDGIEICKQIRQNSLLAEIPVILATAYRLTPKQIEQIMAETQADMLLHKPLPNAAEFHKMLDRLITQKNGR